MPNPPHEPASAMPAASSPGPSAAAPSRPRPGGTPPRFSIVTAVYGVEKYLGDFISSIEKQAFPLERVEVIAVDDGSLDGSAEILRQWHERAPELVTVLTKENGGQGSARNLGMSFARGEWVTFLDPDDMVGSDYLQVVDQFLTAHPKAVMAATARIFFEEGSGHIVDGHPLRDMFVGDRLVDLDREATYFHGSSPSAFFLRSEIERQSLRYDDRVQPNFEDGHFCVRYLLDAPSRQVAFLGSAEYLYRRRADQSSTLQNSLADPRRFTNVPRHGYLDVLRRGEERHGRAPEWVQNFVIYELSWYFSADVRMSGATSAAHGAVGEEFVAILREIRAHLDDAVVASFAVRRLDPAWRDILFHVGDDGPWFTPYVILQQFDSRGAQVRIAYRFTGEPPREEILSGDRLLEDDHRKTRTHIYFGMPLLHERVIWVPMNARLQVKLDGALVPIRTGWDVPNVTSMSPTLFRQRMSGTRAPGARTGLRRVKDISRRLNDPAHLAKALRQRVATKAPLARPTKWLLDQAPRREEFAGAWVLMDRIHDADDSGERLFRYLREHRPDINAWFVLEAGTPDWKRLVRDGYADRLVAHGTMRWKLLMLKCVHLISSHIDVPVHNPPEMVGLRAPSWTFTFLQHGVIKDDLSAWLNPKRLDIFVTSTVPEYESIVGDGSPYVFTRKEVKLTGLPRFDRLLQLGEQYPPERRDLLLVTPTWRHWLTPPLERGSQRRTVREDFLNTEYAQSWLAVLSSPELAEIAAAHGLTIGFLPHPNIQPALPMMKLPAHVTPMTFAGNDVQEYLARTALLVTDYSSMAFNTAYIERPVVYFQFDRDSVLNGGHVGRAGYFDYERDGFGPVTSTVTDTIEQIRAQLGAGGSVPEPYLARVTSTFPLRDGKCCERVTAAIEAL